MCFSKLAIYFFGKFISRSHEKEHLNKLNTTGWHFKSSMGNVLAN